jgi:hypothetical protein
MIRIHYTLYTLSVPCLRRYRLRAGLPLLYAGNLLRSNNLKHLGRHLLKLSLALAYPELDSGMRGRYDNLRKKFTFTIPDLQ